MREAKKLSIAELSHELRVNASALGSVERRQMVPSRRVRDLLCAFFGTEGLFGSDGLAM
jgi:ribosome-binding protein aMBF1 (putative translation factor)